MSMLSSRYVRSAFLDYFRGKGHAIRPSGSVLPPSPELSFVNAGMNHFAGIITGADPIPSIPRVVNSQKCIRLGGRHSDLSIVGTNGTHHTFFEMLGSWSFNDYFKQDAIAFAWEFLRGPLGIPQEHLTVTHYKNDPETAEIWLSLGLDPSKLTALGEADNFWEMGSTGPCGPCTEIHYKGRELWNLVFMESLRVPGGNLLPLDKKHVDTGMGLERLTAVLNGKESNYDTDLFIPLFKKIEELSGELPYSGSFSDPRDLGYRLLADHSRMIAACLSDGLLPDVSYRLRNIIRRSMKISSETFKCSNEVDFLKQMVFAVSESLGDHHMEYLNSPFIKEEAKLSRILEYEAEVLKEHKRNEGTSIHRLKAIVPSKELFESLESEIDTLIVGRLYDAFKMLSSTNENPRRITGEFAFKLYESLGFRNEDIELFARLSNASYNPHDFTSFTTKMKESSKAFTSFRRVSEECLQTVTSAPPTDDSYKYKWVKSGTKYQFYVIESRVSQLIQNTEKGPLGVSKLCRGDVGVILVESTPFYSEAGGQASDSGSIVSLSKGGAENVFHVEDVFTRKGVVYHVGTVQCGSFSSTDVVQMKIDPLKRVLHMQNHSGAHILNAAINSVLPLSTQRSLKIDSSGFKFDACIFKLNLSSDEVNQIEEKANQMINNAEPITRAKDKYLNSYIRNSNLNILTLPGEKYPEKVSIICLSEFGEPCCGTHCNFTNDVEAITITQVKSIASGIKSFRCLTGRRAIDARENGLSLLEHISSIRERMEDLGDFPSKEDKETLLQDISTLRKEALTISIPHTVRHDSELILSELKNLLEESDSLRLRKEIEQIAEDTSHLNYVVHDFGTFEYLYEGRRLSNTLGKKIKNKVVFGSVSNGVSLRICAVVPNSFVNSQSGFSALAILNHVEESLPLGVKVRKNNKMSSKLATLILVPEEKDSFVFVDGLLNSVSDFIREHIG